MISMPLAWKHHFREAKQRANPHPHHRFRRWPRKAECDERGNRRAFLSTYANGRRTGGNAWDVSHFAGQLSEVVAPPGLLEISEQWLFHRYSYNRCSTIRTPLRGGAVY